jgi:putative spermidine/putrescine transport system ATP-binding protein
MKDGLIEQIGAPFEIYGRPATPYVASFIGTLNVLAATVIDAATGALRVEGQTLSAGRTLDAKSGDQLSVSIRPESFSLDGDGTNALDGKVANVKLLGSIVRLVVSVGGRDLSVDGFNDPRRSLPSIGESVKLCVAPEALVVTRPEAAPIVGRAGEEEEVAEGG